MGFLTIVLILQAAGQVFDQPAAGDRLVVMEAESASANVAANGDTWTLSNAASTPAAPAGFVGGGMVCLPDNGSGNADAATFVNGPRLSFRVLFRAAGNHYVWVRGRAAASQPAGNNDSCHVAINGVAAPGAFQMSGWIDTEWRWARGASAGNAVITVPSVGVHTVSVYMREDGFIFDRILLTTNAAYGGFSPVTVAGPAETAVIADQTPPAATAPTLTPGVLRITATWAAVTNADTYVLQRSTSGGAFATVFTGAATNYTDMSTATGIDYCYRVAGVDTAFGAGPYSPPSCAQAQLPPPRTDGHEEGLLGENCACGSTSFGAPGAAAGVVGLLLLALWRRR